MDGYKHYIRLDEQGIVIYAFSSAFEQPLETDICVNEDGGRHYNPQLTNDQRQYIYKYVNGQMVERTEVELAAEIVARPTPPPTEMDILGLQLVEKDIQILQLQAVNNVLGQQLVDLDIRLMTGGL